MVQYTILLQIKDLTLDRPKIPHDWSLTFDLPVCVVFSAPYVDAGNGWLAYQESDEPFVTNHFDSAFKICIFCNLLIQIDVLFWYWYLFQSCYIIQILTALRGTVKIIGPRWCQNHDYAQSEAEGIVMVLTSPRAYNFKLCPE